MRLSHHLDLGPFISGEEATEALRRLGLRPATFARIFPGRVAIVDPKRGFVGMATIAEEISSC